MGILFLAALFLCFVFLFVLEGIYIKLYKKEKKMWITNNKKDQKPSPSAPVTLGAFVLFEFSLLVLMFVI